MQQPTFYQPVSTLYCVRTLYTPSDPTDLTVRHCPNSHCSLALASIHTKLVAVDASNSPYETFAADKFIPLKALGRPLDALRSCCAAQKPILIKDYSNLYQANGQQLGTGGIRWALFHQRSCHLLLAVSPAIQSAPSGTLPLSEKGCTAMEGQCRLLIARQYPALIRTSV